MRTGVPLPETDAMVGAVPPIPAPVTTSNAASVAVTSSSKVTVKDGAELPVVSWVAPFARTTESIVGGTRSLTIVKASAGAVVDEFKARSEAVTEAETVPFCTFGIV